MKDKEAKKSVLKEILGVARKAKMAKKSEDCGSSEEKEEDEDEEDGPGLTIVIGTTKHR